MLLQFTKKFVSSPFHTVIKSKTITIAWIIDKREWKKKLQEGDKFYLAIDYECEMKI